MLVWVVLTTNCRSPQSPTRSYNYPDLSCPSSSNRKSLSSCIEDCIIPQGRCRSENTNRWSCCILAPSSESPRSYDPVIHHSRPPSPWQRGPYLPRFDWQRQLRQRCSSRSSASGDHSRVTRREHRDPARFGCNRERNEETRVLGSM